MGTYILSGSLKSIPKHTGILPDTSEAGCLNEAQNGLFSYKNSSKSNVTSKSLNGLKWSLNTIH